MEIFDNINAIVRDDMKKTIKKKSKLAIVTACFSIYAFNELKSQLKNIEELRFIFSLPTFTAQKPNKQQREFYIPRYERENSLYGTEFELKLKNSMNQKAIAKECAEWIRRKVRFKSNVTGENMNGFMTVDTGKEHFAYLPLNGFTTIDIGCERGNNIYNMVTKIDAPHAMQYIKLFDNLWRDNRKMEDVTEQVLTSISNAYKENSPQLIYFITLYHVFREFLEDISDDFLPNEDTGFRQSRIWNMLYDFQQDAVLSVINKLERYNGCILADSVGLGKTFSALAVIKYYENRNKSVLVLCPKKLAENWNTYKNNYLNNPLSQDRLNYDVLFHTDLTRKKGISNGIDLDRVNWGNYDLIVIDESHNFRNGGDLSGEDKRENRYLQLMNKVIRSGVRTKVLMLSATPVNNRFYDLRNQLALAYEGHTDEIDNNLNTKKSIDEIFKQAQRDFNVWSKLPAEQRTTENLLKTLDFDFFELLDSVTIARSRKHIQKYYASEKVGKFPERLKPISKRPKLTSIDNAVNYRIIYEYLNNLNLRIYTPSDFVFESKLTKYFGSEHKSKGGLTQRGREQGIKKLMSINLLKRLESSVYSFRLSLQRIREFIYKTMAIIDSYDESKLSMIDNGELSEQEFDIDDSNTAYFTTGDKVKISLADMDYMTWREELSKDAYILDRLVSMVDDITPAYDSKLVELLKLISQKIEHPINKGNKKIIIFSAFSDTAEYLYREVSDYVRKEYGLKTALVTGSIDGRTNARLKGVTMNDILMNFSPVSKERDILLKNNPKAQKDDIDILIATDCISEGQNLQDCDYLINYDIHWNPVRIIQRFGRIDRIGSTNEKIQLVNFWLDLTLDEYINLKARVETRMKISVMTSTGDDNLLSPEEKGDLEYRRKQLEKLQNEVVDIEEMTGGVSILDLGLNEFRLDLLEYIREHEDLAKNPCGIHAVTKATDEFESGVIFVLKNKNNAVNIGQMNRIHPFYMVYISEGGDILCDYLDPKKLLDIMRKLCKEVSEPYMELCEQFNEETDDGNNMAELSELLSMAIKSIISTKEDCDIDSLFKSGGTTALLSEINGLDDFELICFLSIK